MEAAVETVAYLYFFVGLCWSAAYFVPNNADPRVPKTMREWAILGIGVCSIVGLIGMSAATDAGSEVWGDVVRNLAFGLVLLLSAVSFVLKRYTVTDSGRALVFTKRQPKVIEPALLEPSVLFDAKADLSETPLTEHQRQHRELFLQGTIYGFISDFRHVHDCHVAQVDGLLAQAVREGWVYDPHSPEAKVIQPVVEVPKDSGSFVPSLSSERTKARHEWRRKLSDEMGVPWREVASLSLEALQSFGQTFGAECVACGKLRFKQSMESEAWEVEDGMGGLVRVDEVWRCRVDCGVELRFAPKYDGSLAKWARERGLPVHYESEAVPDPKIITDSKLSTGTGVEIDPVAVVIAKSEESGPFEIIEAAKATLQGCADCEDATFSCCVHHKPLFQQLANALNKGHTDSAHNIVKHMAKLTRKAQSRSEEREDRWDITEDGWIRPHEPEADPVRRGPRC